MHVTTKEVDDQGTHLITSTVEADGPNPLCSDKASFSASIVSVARTISGGFELQAAVRIVEPVAEPEPAAEPVAAEPTAEEKAAAYLETKGLSADEATAAVAKFGAARVLSEQQRQLDIELFALTAPTAAEPTA